MRKRVLLTGIGGFVGAHCLEYFQEFTNWEVIGIDSFQHKGTCLRTVESDLFDRVPIYTHDLTVPIDEQLENILLDRSIDSRGKVCEKPIDYIINMASDSAVERSATDPTYCVKNNVNLALTMLEFARKNPPELFVQISTDEVYGEAEPDQSHHEWDVILPSNPYAASKASQEAIASAYWRTYDLPIIITNTMNIIGERQHPEKFLPKIIQYVAQGKEVPIYADFPDGPDGDPFIGTRVYLDARNKADALKFLTKQPIARYSQGAKRPDRYNICGNDELNNLELAQLVADVMGKELKYKLVSSESVRPGYDRRYALDNSKLAGMGWKAPCKFRDTVERIVKWTQENQHWMI